MSPEIVSVAERALDLACDALVVGACTGDEGPKLSPTATEADRSLDGQLVEHLSQSGFKGKLGDVAVVPTFGRLAPLAVAVVGLGSKEDLRPSALRRASGTAARALSERSVIGSMLHELIPGDEGTRAAIEGFLLGGYRFSTYKTDPHPTKTQRVVFPDAPEEAIQRAIVAARATALARDLTNEPSSSLTPEVLADRARSLAEDAGLECTILDEHELAAKGFGGILGVASGSAVPPRLIQLRYVPEQQPVGKVAIVGKGVTFDSGGLSLKDAKNMEAMKTDKGGAAAVLATMSAVGGLGVRVEVIGLVPATENMPGGRALKPGDVLSHYGGTTTEVLNTDAEGRLILADALAFACEQDPDAVVDIATLTGSILVALGPRVSGLFSNDDALTRELQTAAEAAGERVWPMPLVDDYKSELDSEVADAKNIGSRYGGAITAALFLSRFVKDGIPWAHLDIAGAARSERDYDEISKGATGAGTRTLIEWIERRES
jgi:leucyl aminopeptidase